MKKNFIFDTNVLLNDPHAILKFEDNNVVIPITVIEELDKFKRDLNALGRNAREVARLIDGYRAEGSLAKGVKLEGGGTLRVVTDLGKEPPLPFPTLGKTADSLILAAALLLKKREDLPVVFVTRDINLRLRADAVGLKAVNYEEEDSVTIEEMYPGRADIQMSGELVNEFQQKGSIDAGEFKLLPNQCVTLIDEGDAGHWVLGRYHKEEGKILPLLGENEEMWGIRSLNAEQSFAIDLLLDDSISIVTLAGKAGTGKTLLAIAVGLKKSVDDRAYAKLVVARPVMPMGKDLGFLPGQISEKLNPWMQPVYDNLELILSSKGSEPDISSKGGDSKRSRRKSKKPLSEGIRQLTDMGILDVEALTYIRGRSMPQQYLIIDEAQNLTHHEVRTIITRAGKGTKVVLTGDPYQIDSPFLDSSSSGLTVVVERFKNEDMAGHITLLKGERSPLAELASNIL